MVAYVAVWIVTWTSFVSVSGMVTKCCPRDMILKIDMSSCTGYLPYEQNQRESYTYDNETVDIASNDTVDVASNDDPALSVSNSDFIPWWIPSDMEFLRASNLSLSFEPNLGSFNADGRLPCSVDDREVTVIDEDVAVLDDGRLIMFGQENRSAADGHGQLIFESAEYCVDRVSLLDNFNVSAKSGSGSSGGGAHKKKNRRNVFIGNGTTIASSAFTYVALVCRPCSRITCVPKCCAKGYVLEYLRGKISGCRKAQSVVDANAAIHLKAANGTILHRKDYFFFGMKPPDCGDRSWYMLNKTGTDTTTAASAGSKPIGYGLFPDGRVQVDDGGMPIERDEYCVDAMNVVPDGVPAAITPSNYTDVLLACRLGSNTGTTSFTTDGPLGFRTILYGVYFVVGAMFLAATLLIYAMLPELRVTVHSGNLIAHTVCLFVSYATLAATTLVRYMFNNCACIIAGFVIQFSFLAAFFWLNVMCADIAWTFSGFRLLLYSNKIENEKKKYVIYSVYAWGCSVGITALTALAEFTQSFGEHRFKPNFGQRDCWFSNKSSVGIFFYLPIGLLLLTNFILFLFTAFRIVFIRRDTSKVLNRQNNQNNMRLSLYLKLFCLMGVTFVFEVISWAVDAPAYYWYATDAVNSLRGVFVFFIFCWKRSVLNLLLARAPESVRQLFVRIFGVIVPHRNPSFSSSCQPNHFARGTTVTGSTRTHSSSASAHNTVSGRNSSFQLSQFGSSASMTVARKNSTGVGRP